MDFPGQFWPFRFCLPFFNRVQGPAAGHGFPVLAQSLSKSSK